MFGMGTGVASPPESPGFLACRVSAAPSRSERIAGRPRSGPVGLAGVLKNFDFAECAKKIPSSRADPWSGAEEVKPSTISTAQLHPSRGFHMPPIEQVVYLRSYPVDPVGNLILRRASHLDAFSAYPFAT